MNTLSLLLLFCVATTVLCSYTSEYDQFNSFIAKYDKEYKTAAEWDLRFHIFKDNLKTINQLNAEVGEAVHGVNRFADLTSQEFDNYACGGNLIGKFPNREFPEVFNAPSAINPNDLPTLFDWTQKGAVTPVKDQGQCGSCWAFSAIGNLEGAAFLSGKGLIGLSESELVDCGKTSYGCAGGWPFWALGDLMKDPFDGGVDTEKSYPYVPSNRKCSYNASTIGATVSNYTSYCHEQTPACTESQIQDLLTKLGPLSVCLNAQAMQFYTKGVSKPPSCNPSFINHCITLVGWGTDTDTSTQYWKLKNSWGTSWGEDGYYRLVRGVSADQPAGRCGINTVVTAAHI